MSIAIHNFKVSCLKNPLVIGATKMDICELCFFNVFFKCHVLNTGVLRRVFTSLVQI